MNAFHIGSRTNVPLAFFANSSGPRLTIATSGNVGIGTTNPSAKLHVSGGDIAVDAAARKIGYITDPGGAAYSGYLQPYDLNGFTNIVNGFGSGGITFTTQQTERMRISAAGNVGIGTTAPLARLDVRGEIWIGGSTAPALRWRDGVNEYATGRILANDLAFEVAGVERLRIQNSTGNVGIGTSNATHKLTVNGAVRAKVVVDTGWSDYVFAPDYELTALRDVETHVREHRHLPGIPSAAQVHQNGISLGEMQAMLLAKIEELTLHAIAQEKRQQEHAEKYQELAAKIQRLEEENGHLRAAVEQ